MPSRPENPGRSGARILGAALGALVVAIGLIAWSLLGGAVESAVESGSAAVPAARSSAAKAVEESSVYAPSDRDPAGRTVAARSLTVDRALELLSGRVVDRVSGEGVEGARIAMLAGAFRRETTSVERGEFQLEWPGDLAAALEVQRAGFVTLRRPEVDLGSSDAIKLERVGSFDGRVTDSLSLAAEGASVLVWREADRKETAHEVTAGADGRFKIPAVTPGNYEVGIRSERTPLVIERGVRVLPGEATLINLTLATGTALVGQVVLRTDKSPVEGVLLAIGDRTSVTDAEGHYALYGAPVGPSKVTVLAPWGGRLAFDVDLAASDVPTEKSVRIPAPASLAGEVVDAAGKPRAGVLVVAVADSEGKDLDWSDSGLLAAYPGAVQVLTDGEGAFLFEALPARERLLVMAIPQGAGAFAAFDRSVRLVDGEERTGLLLQFTEGAPLLGRVVQVDEGPALPGATVTLKTRVGATWSDWAVTHTDAEGLFAFASVPGKVARLSVERSGFATFIRQATVGTDETIEIAMKPANALSGHVISEDGNALQGVRVITTSRKRGAKSQTAETDEFGRFHLDDMALGEAFLTPRLAGWRAITSEPTRVVIPDDGHVVITMLRFERPLASTVTGEIALRANGAPVRGLVLRGTRGGAVRFDGTHFRISGMRPGRVELLAEANGKETLFVEPFNLAAGMTVDVGRHEMRSAARVTVTVKDGSGKLLEGATVRMRALDRDKGGWGRKRNLSLKRRAPGEYRNPTVPRYNWRLTVAREGFRDHSEVLRVRSGRVEKTVELRRRKPQVPSAGPGR